MFAEIQCKPRGTASAHRACKTNVLALEGLTKARACASVACKQMHSTHEGNQGERKQMEAAVRWETSAANAARLRPAATAAEEPGTQISWTPRGELGCCADDAQSGRPVNASASQPSPSFEGVSSDVVSACVYSAVENENPSAVTVTSLGLEMYLSDVDDSESES